MTLALPPEMIRLIFEYCGYQCRICHLALTIPEDLYRRHGKYYYCSDLCWIFT